jgi:hypothetical protein
MPCTIRTWLGGRAIVAASAQAPSVAERIGTTESPNKAARSGVGETLPAIK